MINKLCSISKRRLLLIHLCIGQCILSILNTSVIFILDKLMDKKCDLSECKILHPSKKNHHIMNHFLVNKGKYYYCLREDLMEVALIISYYWGIIPASIIGVWLSEIYSPCSIITVAALFSGFFQGVIPFLHSVVHSAWICVIRFILGMLRGIILYATYKLVSFWIPKHEQGILMAAMNGNSCGIFFCWLLMHETYLNGWQYSFFLSGIIIILWTGILICGIFDNPITHSSITQEELKYLAEYIPLVARPIVKKEHFKMPPIWKILTNRPFIAYVFLNLGDTWSFAMLLILSPKFLCFNSTETKLKSALYISFPLLLNFFAGIVFGKIGDVCIRKQKKSTTIRKLFTVFSHMISGFLILGITFPTGDRWLHSTILNHAAFAFQGASVLTNAINPIDLSPTHFNTLYAIAKIVECLLGNIIVGIITCIFNSEKIETSILTFHILLTICAFWNIVTAIIYCKYGSGEVQNFDKGNVNEVINM